MQASRSARAPKKFGLAFWMERVLEECDRAGDGLAADPVHDLRVALRRCRSMADGLLAVDPDPAWKHMKKAGKALFSRLGELRDVQVMEEWVRHFDSAGDPVAARLIQFLSARESQHKQEAALALQEFDRKQWLKWTRTLPRRTAKLRPGSVVFRHLALERLTQARELHQQAMRNRSQAAFHQLRIGIKRFRYIVENFLPQQHLAWGDDLKKLQDLLGDIHDLDVLSTVARQAGVFHDPEDRARWHAKIVESREQRIKAYREKMQGPNALWGRWQEHLPQGEQIHAAAVKRLQLWASYFDPDRKHSDHVARLALQLQAGLTAQDGHDPQANANDREILRLAALLHDVGRSKNGKNHHKQSFRMIRKLAAPLGVSEQVLQLAGVVARYHRGALPRSGQPPLRELPAAEKREALRLAGILRLANALDAERDASVRRVCVEDASLSIAARGRTGIRLPRGPMNGKAPKRSDVALVVRAEGFRPASALARAVAAERYLLETVQRRPIVVRPLRTARPTRRAGFPTRAAS